MYSMCVYDLDCYEYGDVSKAPIETIEFNHIPSVSTILLIKDTRYIIKRICYYFPIDDDKKCHSYSIYVSEFNEDEMTEKDSLSELKKTILMSEDDCGWELTFYEDVTSIVYFEIEDGKRIEKERTEYTLMHDVQIAKAIIKGRELE